MGGGKSRPVNTSHITAKIAEQQRQMEQMQKQHAALLKQQAEQHKQLQEDANKRIQDIQVLMNSSNEENKKRLKEKETALQKEIEASKKEHQRTVTLIEQKRQEEEAKLKGALEHAELEKKMFEEQLKRADEQAASLENLLKVAKGEAEERENMNAEEAKQYALRVVIKAFLAMKRGEIDASQVADLALQTKDRGVPHYDPENLMFLCPREEGIDANRVVRTAVMGFTSVGKSSMLNKMLRLKGDAKLKTGRKRITSQISRGGAMELVGPLGSGRLVFLDAPGVELMEAENVFFALETVYNCDIVMCLYRSTPAEVKDFVMIAEMMQKQVFFVQTQLDTDYMMDDEKEKETPESFARRTLKSVREYGTEVIRAIPYKREPLQWFGISCQPQHQGYFHLEHLRKELLDEATRIVRARIGNVPRDVVTTTSSSEGATSSNALVFKNGANCTVTEGNIIEKIPDLTGTDEVNGCCTSIDTVISTDDEIVKVRLHVLNTKASNIYFGVVPTSFHERWKALWLKNGWFLNLENGNLSSGQPFFKNINGKVGNGEWVEMTINTKANTISFGVKGTESSVAYMNFLEGDADRHLRVCILLRHDGDRVKATC
eukprot:m.41742 g.41742  ORF g.41742 m.41742 type:complete len:604 (-) comp7020_c0_seq2:63-1874(-)